jgi:hypothetical protein
VFQIGGGGSGSPANEEASSSTSLQDSAAAGPSGHQQQQQKQAQELAVLNEAGEEGQLPSVRAPSVVYEPNRPVRLLGEDGRVTETLNASE